MCIGGRPTGRPVGVFGVFGVFGAFGVFSRPCPRVRFPALGTASLAAPTTTPSTTMVICPLTPVLIKLLVSPAVLQAAEAAARRPSTVCTPHTGIVAALGEQPRPGGGACECRRCVVLCPRVHSCVSLLCSVEGRGVYYSLMHHFNNLNRGIGIHSRVPATSRFSTGSGRGWTRAVERPRPHLPPTLTLLTRRMVPRSTTRYIVQCLHGTTRRAVTGRRRRWSRHGVVYLRRAPPTPTEALAPATNLPTDMTVSTARRRGARAVPWFVPSCSTVVVFCSS